MTRLLQRPLRRPLRAPYGPGASMDYAGSASGNSAGMWWAGTDYWLDLANNYGMNNGAPITPTGVIADTHAASIYAPDTTSLYSSFAANVLTRTGLGVQTVPTRTNSIRNNSNTGAAVGTIGSGGAFPTNWSRQNVTGLSTDIVAFGTASNGLPYIDVRVYGTNSSGSTRSYAIFIEPSGASAIATAASATWAISAFEQLVAGSIPAGVSGTGWGFNTFIGAGTYLATHQGSSTPSATLSRASYSTAVGGTAAFIQPLWSFSITNGTAVDITVRICAPQLELGAFASAPILTTAASATVNGNQQVIDLTGRLGTGVAGLIQFYPQDIGAAGDAALVLSNNTLNERVQLINSSGVLRIQAYVGGVSQGSIGILGAYSAALQTVAFAAQSGFMLARRVGQADPGSYALPAYPTMSQIALGGGGYNTGVNMFQFTCKLALSFGPQDQTSFDAMFARAQLAAVA